MATDRRQINVRLPDDASERYDRLLESVPAALGLPEIKQPQLVALALLALEQCVEKGEMPKLEPSSRKKRTPKAKD